MTVYLLCINFPGDGSEVMGVYATEQAALDSRPLIVAAYRQNDWTFFPVEEDQLYVRPMVVLNEPSAVASVPDWVTT